MSPEYISNDNSSSANWISGWSKPLEFSISSLGQMFGIESADSTGASSRETVAASLG